MHAESLSVCINQPVTWARQLLVLHRLTYPVFWAWSDRVVNQALLGARLWTAFGWQLHVDANPNTRSLRNFPLQASGAEMCPLEFKRERR
jgi:DNA polymerase-1